MVVFVHMSVLCVVALCVYKQGTGEDKRIREEQRRRERMCVLVYWGMLELCLMSQTKSWIDWV